MTLTRRPTIADDLRYVVANWREVDQREIMAFWHSDNAASYALVSAAILEEPSIPKICRTVCLDGVPVAVWGAIQHQPTVWTVFAFGTDDWPKVVLFISKHIRRVLIPTLYDLGANVAECWASAEHTQACDWLEWLGAQPLSMLPRGKHGENFIHYVWTREDAISTIGTKGPSQSNRAAENDRFDPPARPE